MSNIFIKTAVRTMFGLTGRIRAMQQARHLLDKYMKLAGGLSREEGSRPIEVPPMRGVDEDMRRWSFYMILEHNRIVNDSISAIIRQLVRGEPLSGAAAIDPKKGVMPSPSAGEEQIASFQQSVEDHLKAVNSLGKLRGTLTAPHMVFGEFNAHMWNCMFSFHLKIHYPQADYVVRATKTDSGSDGRTD